MIVPTPGSKIKKGEESLDVIAVIIYSPDYIEVKCGWWSQGNYNTEWIRLEHVESGDTPKLQIGFIDAQGSQPQHP